jgi:hypothetical protein
LEKKGHLGLEEIFHQNALNPGQLIDKQGQEKIDRTHF